jgi:hypothetical protein
MGLAVEKGRHYDFEGGAASDAIEYIRNHGSCSQTALFNSTGGRDAYSGALQDRFRAHMKTALDDLFHELQRVPDTNHPWDTVFTIRARQIERAHPYWTSGHSTLQAIYEIAQPYANTLCDYLATDGFPMPEGFASTAQSAGNVLAAYLAEAASPLTADTDFYDHYFRDVCRGATRDFSSILPATQEEFYYPNTERAPDIRARLHRLLTRAGAQPVGISICANVLQSAAPWRGTSFSTSDNTLHCAADASIGLGADGRHAVVVVGQRWNTGNNRCEFLVRNSWGTGCNSYAAGMECSGGQVWVNEADLSENTFRVTWLGAPDPVPQ